MELNDLFDYGLKIYQNPSYFKFSLDSILLAEFVKFKDGDEILDICTGNIPIPLILTTKSQTVHITAIEIQKEVHDLALASLEINELRDRIDLYNADARAIVLPHKYDIVLANPPYFKVTDTSQKNRDMVKRIARHEVELTLADTIKVAKQNLSENGTFYLVQRTDRFLETVELLNQNRFGIRRAVFVYTKTNSDAEIFLIEASRHKKSDLKVRSLYTSDLTTYKNIFEEW